MSSSHAPFRVSCRLCLYSSGDICWVCSNLDPCRCGYRLVFGFRFSRTLRTPKKQAYLHYTNIFVISHAFHFRACIAYKTPYMLPPPSLSRHSYLWFGNGKPTARRLWHSLCLHAHHLSHVPPSQADTTRTSYHLTLLHDPTAPSPNPYSSSFDSPASTARLPFPS